ncbi:MAG: type II toxin-antitoxin system PemK/MazF family toxin [Butyrivibrio sp.]|nr:type II toxin-antitoxin system PemK/MazF family toxin [Butyrivibrio sp.]
MDIRRGDIYYADLAPVVGSEQGGTRPVLIIQNDTGNRHSPTVIAAAITSRQGKKPLPTHIRMGDSPHRLEQESTVLLEQVRTIDRARLKEYIGRAGRATMQDVDHAIAVSFGLEGMLFPQGSRDAGKKTEKLPVSGGRDQKGNS